MRYCPYKRGQRDMHIVRLSCEHKEKIKMEWYVITKALKDGGKPPGDPSRRHRHTGTFFLDCQPPERRAMQYCGLKALRLGSPTRQVHFPFLPPFSPESDWLAEWNLPSKGLAGGFEKEFSVPVPSVTSPSPIPAAGPSPVRNAEPYSWTWILAPPVACLPPAWVSQSEVNRGDMNSTTACWWCKWIWHYKNAQNYALHRLRAY